MPLLESVLAGKEGLRSLFTSLSSLIEELGPDVRAEPAGTHVSFVRGREFALGRGRQWSCVGSIYRAGHQ